MNSIFDVATISRTLDAWLATMFRASWQGGLAIALIWAAILAMPFIRPKLRSWLWRLVCLKLLISLIWIAPIPLALLRPMPVIHRQAATTVFSMPVDPTPQIFQPAPSNLTEPHAATMVEAKLTWWQITVFSIWVVGVLLRLARNLHGLKLARGLRSGAILIHDEILKNETVKLCNSMGIRVPPQVASSENISSPLLIGMRHPTILLPTHFSMANARNLKIILAHELAHLRRRDLAWGMLTNLAGVIFFFHPLVWLMQRESRLSSEAACDLEAMQTTETDGKSYADLLIDLAAYQSASSKRMVGAIGIVETMTGLRKRLSLVMGAKRIASRKLAAVEFIVVIIVLPGLFSWQLIHRTSAEDIASADAFSSTRPAGVLLTGQVLQPNGKPASGATVCFESGNYRGEYDPTILRQTDVHGQFSMAIPPASTRPDNAENLFAFLPGVGFSEPTRSRTSPAQLQLKPVADVEVTFVGPDGKPVVGLHVWPAAITFDHSEASFDGSYVDLAEDVGRQWGVKTGGGGKCIVRNLPRGAYVKFDTDDDRFAEMTFKDRVWVQPADTVLPQTIRPTSAATIVGQVTDSETGKGVAGVGVGAQGANDNPGGWGHGITDADGRFVLKRLLAGLYVVSLEDHSLFDWGWTARAIEVRTVANQSVHGDLSLIRGGFVKGKVRDAITGQPVRAAIGLYGPSKPMSAAAVLVRTTDNDGAFSFRVAPGKQSLYLFGKPKGYLPTTFDYLTSNVDEGDTATVNFDLSPDRTPDVTGQIIDPDGKTVAGATILCDDPQSDSPISPTRSAVSDEEGHFHIDHVDNGRVLRARWKGLATMNAIEVGADNRKLTIRLTAGAVYGLRVQATDAGGVVVPGATVALETLNGRFGTRFEGVPVDKNGNVSFDSLFSDMKYYVWAEAPGYGVFQSRVLSPKTGTAEQVVPAVLHAATSVISGRVVDSTGAPAAHVVVAINGSETGVQIMRTDADGKFAFKVVESARRVLVSVNGQYDARHRPLATTASAGDKNVKLVMQATD